MIEIGIIVKIFGLKGECKVKSMTDFVEQRFKKGSQVYVHYLNEWKPLKVEGFRIHQGMVLVKFDGHDSIESVEQYTGCKIGVLKEQLHDLKQGEYYFFELKGCRVLDEAAQEIGIVSRVEENPIHNHLRVLKNDGTSSLVPFIPNFILSVNLDKKEIVIKNMVGLL